MPGTGLGRQDDALSRRRARGRRVTHIGSLSPAVIPSPAYRRLIDSGRAYAAFTTNHLALVDELRDFGGSVLDPTSGYGLLHAACQRRGLSSYGVELNAPQYLWQRMTLPQDAAYWVRFVDAVLRRRSDWPDDPVTRVALSWDWFPSVSLELLTSLFAACVDVASSSAPHPTADPTWSAAALLLPFASRLASCVEGDVTHVKRGGMCVYSGWREDFATYLHALRSRLAPTSKVQSHHEVALADARVYRPGGREFGRMLTSPPYPNRSDYESIFAVENELIRLLSDRLPEALCLEERLIGSNRTGNLQPRCPSSPSASGFLNSITSKKWSSRKQERDEKGYYFDYYSQYFCGIEELYENVSTWLAPAFHGFIVVRDNTHHGMTVPVAASIMETWTGLGFSATIRDADEVFHVGTKNPRARGARAKHMEYVIEVMRP